MLCWNYLLIEIGLFDYLPAATFSDWFLVIDSQLSYLDYQPFKILFRETKKRPFFRRSQRD